MNKYILIGLGNPGDKYASTRHNAGKMFVRWINKGRRNFEAIETECYMNESGSWIKKWLDQKGIKSTKGTMGIKGHFNPNFPSGAFDTSDTFDTFLFIFHDDLDIPLGKFKIQFGKGPRQHRGLESIYQALGTKDFWHVRIGIDNREEGRGKKEEGQTGEDYVLSPFSKAEMALLETEVFPKIGEELERRISYIYLMPNT